MLIVIAGCCGLALLAIVAAALAGAVTPAIAIVLAVGSASLAGILVLGLWLRRLDAKVQRVSDRLAREAARAAARPVPAPCRIDAVAPRLERLETAVARIGDTTAHLTERVETVLATLGEDRVEAVYRHKRYTELLTGVAEDLRRVTAQARATVTAAGDGDPVRHGPADGAGPGAGGGR
ncbi:MAG: hypothetical protein DIU60_004140 [Actinomycetes bacterium]|nr:MAG: hypothetical protein DIU60_13065 [Actinomycetota bacterium]